MELCSKEVAWLLNRSEDWLRHARSDKVHWNTPKYYKDGRRVYYMLPEVVGYANRHGIELPSLRGSKYCSDGDAEHAINAGEQIESSAPHPFEKDNAA